MKFFICILIFLLEGSYMHAQNYVPEQRIPNDTAVRIGRLDNGMTYYICHCAKPVGRAEFYIVHNVGALQEDKDQRGLAHFLEHMAFNGTENFPKKTMLEYLAGIGVSFGANVNAFTSKTITAYNISAVPLLRESIVDSVLLMLHDWSGYISCEPDEINAERGVIREEWRRSQLPRTRLAEQLAPVLYNYSKYANNVLGEYDIIMNFKRETLLDFYHKWYRPDLQAVIVVGDMDVNEMERKIKDRMSQLKKAVNPTPKEVYTVPDNREPLVGISTDPSAAATVVRIGYKQNVPQGKDRSTYSTFRTDLMRSMTVELLKRRLVVKNKEVSPNLLQKMMGISELTPDKKMIFIMATVKDAKVLPALEELAEEIECVKRYGFTQDEFSQVQQQTVKNNKVQKAINSANESDNIVRTCMKHFSEKAPLILQKDYDELSADMTNRMTLADINQGLKTVFGDRNVVITLLGPQKDGLVYPLEKEFVSTFKSVKKKDVQPFVEEKVEVKELMSQKPVPGRIVSEQQGVLPNTTEWTLSNGVRVVLKSMETTSSQVKLTAFSEGGLSLVSEDELPAAIMLNQYCRIMGTGDFSREQLSKMNSKKIVSIEPSLKSYYEAFIGNAEVKDVETLMQMLNMYFTKPRLDEKEYDGVVGKTKHLMINRKGLPKIEYQDKITAAKYDHHSRMKPLSLNDTVCMNFETARKIYKERFADAGSFTFIFTGKIDPKVLKPLLETYIASLPSKGERETYRDHSIRYAKGEIISHTEMEMPVPRATVDITYSAYLPVTPENHVCAIALRNIMSERYMKSIREDKGGTYYVAVSADENKVPENQIVFTVNFETAPEIVDELLVIVQKGVGDIMAEVPNRTELDNARQYYEKSFKSNVVKEGYWMDILEDYYKYGIDNYTNYTQIWDGLTPEDVRAYAEKLFSQKNKMEFVLKSKK